MSSAAPPVDPSRALQRIEPRLPARRPSNALVLLGARALPALTAVLTTAAATLAAEQALRSMLRRPLATASTASASQPERRSEAAPRAATEPVEVIARAAGRVVVTEYFTIERSRRMR